MLPLQHLKRRNLGNSQSPAKRIKPENQAAFRRKHFSFTQESLKSEVFDLLYYQKNVIKTKLRLTKNENEQILNKIGFVDDEIEGWINSEIGEILNTLKDEMTSVLKNHFREQIYSQLTIKHCTNVFKHRDFQASRKIQAFNPQSNLNTKNLPRPNQALILNDSKSKKMLQPKTSTPINGSKQAPYLLNSGTIN